jgi:DNA-binding SARP family transcriptional activator
MRKGVRISAERPRLERELDRLETGGLAIIAGSAGYGKSSSVASWSTRSGGSTRWIRAARGLADALALAADEDAGVWLPRLSRAVRRGQNVLACASALSVDLAIPHSALTLVIDDADTLATDPEGLTFLRLIAERGPDTSRVILIGRRSASLRLATARSKRGVLEIGAQALRISPQQTRQIAEARGWSGTPTQLEEARRAAAGNGGVLAAWLARETDTALQGDLNDFICRDVVAGSAPLLRRLAHVSGEQVDRKVLSSLWGEGLLIAPASHDELGGEGWAIPEMIAAALNLSPSIARHVAAPSEPPTYEVQVRPQRVGCVVIHDLGPLVVEANGITVAGSSIRPRSLALLMYLGTRPRHSATREEAIDALWPDADQQAGLNSLNQAIYHLRRAIDPDYDAASEGGATPYVRHEAEIVSMNPELVQFDSARLSAQLNKIRVRPRAEELEELLDNYHGPFGAELPFEPWVERYRSTLEVGLLAVVERAIAAAHAAGDYDRAINLAARAARIDPENGGLLESLAMLLAEDGALTGARRAARRAVTVLREMEIAPPAALLQLSERQELRTTRALSERTPDSH